MNKPDYIKLKDSSLKDYTILKERISNIDVSTRQGCIQFLTELGSGIKGKIVHTCDITQEFDDEIEEFIKYYNFGVLRDELKQKSPVFYKFMGKDYKVRNRTKLTVIEFTKVLRVFLRKLNDSKGLSLKFTPDDIDYIHEKYHEGSMTRLWVAPSLYNKDIKYVRVSINSIEDHCERSVSSGVHSRVPLNAVIAFLIHYGIIKDIVGGEGVPHKTQKYCRCFKVSQGYLASVYRNNVDKIEVLSKKDRNLIEYKKELEILNDENHKLLQRVMSITKSLKSILLTEVHCMSDDDILALINGNYLPLTKMNVTSNDEERKIAAHVVNLYLHDSFRLLKQHTIDNYGKRMYTSFTMMNKKIRPYLTMNRQEIYEADANCASIRSIFLMTNNMLNDAADTGNYEESIVEEDNIKVSIQGQSEAKRIYNDRDHVYHRILEEMKDIKNDLYEIMYKYTRPGVVGHNGHVNDEVLSKIPEFTKTTRNKLKKQYIREINSSALKIDRSMRGNLNVLTSFFVSHVPFYRDILKNLSTEEERPVLNKYKTVRIDSRTGKVQMKKVMVSPIARITQTYESDRISRIMNQMYSSELLSGRISAVTVHDAIYFSIENISNEDIVEVRGIYKEVFGSDVKINKITES